MSNDPEEERTIALALSGGGSRAIAFHLGCLRALNHRGLLKNIKTVSSVSGGSVIAAAYCLDGEDFDAFEKRITAFEDPVQLLRRQPRHRFLAPGPADLVLVQLLQHKARPVEEQQLHPVATAIAERKHPTGKGIQSHRLLNPHCKAC